MIKINYRKVASEMENRFPYSTIRKYEAFGYVLEDATTLEEMSFMLRLSIEMTVRYLRQKHREKRIILDRYLVPCRTNEEFYYLIAVDDTYDNYLNWEKSKSKLIEEKSVRRRRRKYRKRMEKKLEQEKLVRGIVSGSSI